MSKKQSQDDSIDPRLEGLLEPLRQVPPRSPQAVEAGRAQYLAELEELELPPAPGPWAWMGGLLSRIGMVQEGFMMSRKKLVIYAALSIVLAVMMLFGGAAATAYASQSALPGDALYFVKAGLESARLRLASDAADRAELYLEFAERRLDELEGLIEQRRYDEIAETVLALQSNIEQAVESFQIAAQAGEPRAADLAVRLSAALSRFADALAEMMALVPEAVRPQVEQALTLSLETSQMGDEVEFTGVVESQTPDEWVVDGMTLIILPSTEIEGEIIVGDLVKVHALQAEDGTLTAREIELADEEDNDNANENENANENDNENDNENLNSNENVNENGNDNVDSSNDNSNDNDHEGNDND